MGFCAPIIYAYIETLQRDGGAGASVIGERFTLYDTTDATADLLVSLGVIESVPNEVDHSLTFFGAVVGGKRGRGWFATPPKKVVGKQIPLKIIEWSYLGRDAP